MPIRLTRRWLALADGYMGHRSPRRQPSHRARPIRNSSPRPATASRRARQTQRIRHLTGSANGGRTVVRLPRFPAITGVAAGKACDSGMPHPTGPDWGDAAMRASPRQSDPAESVSERAQEVDNCLLVEGRELVEVGDHLIGLGAGTRMSLDRRDQAGGPAVMQEEDPLADAPERCRAELRPVGVALADLVLQPAAHVVQGDIAEGLEADEALVGERRRSGRVPDDVAIGTADIDELVFA